MPIDTAVGARSMVQYKRLVLGGSEATAVDLITQSDPRLLYSLPSDGSQKSTFVAFSQKVCFKHEAQCRRSGTKDASVERGRMLVPRPVVAQLRGAMAALYTVRLLSPVAVLTTAGAIVAFPRND